MSGLLGVGADSVDFGGLAIEFGDDVLRPRAWTIAQSQWAAELLTSLPAGPVLELCAGVGHIGLAATAATQRALVLVDSNPSACAWARRNVASAGMTLRTDIRCADLNHAVVPGEQFMLVIADPPWVRTGDVGRYADDPVTAIDGGCDGLDVAMACAAVIDDCLAPAGVALIQLGSAEQAAAFSARLPEATSLGAGEIRSFEPGGVVVRLERFPGYTRNTL